MKTLRILTALALVLPAPALAGPPIDPAKVEATGARAMGELELIGLTVAVVDKDGTVIERQFGLRELGKPETIDADTLWPIESLTKAFTAASLALLVERGKVHWEDPLVQYMPEFDLGDPWVTAHFTVRDLLTHRSGLSLGAGDLLLSPAEGSTPADIIASLKAIPPATGFREKYAYDNVLYVLAGDLVRRIDGRKWEDFVRQELFAPLGMSRCTAMASERLTKSNRITEHAPFPGSDGHEVLNPKMILNDSFYSAGSIGCPVGDMAKWARMWLNNGAIDADHQLLSKESVKELWTLVTPTGTSIPFDETKQKHLSGYALGWFVGDMLGRVVASHSGGSFGATSYLMIAPEEGVATIAMTNTYSSGASSVAQQLMQDMLVARPLPSHDYIADAAKRWTEQQSNVSAIEDSVAPPKGAKAPPVALAGFTGTFRDPWFGEATVSQRDGKLWLDLPHGDMLDGPLNPYDGTRFSALWPERRLMADAFVDFIVEDGKVTGFTMLPVSKETDFSWDFKDLRFVRSGD
ncbi:serine hydrolase [Altererythrobacter salegens]|uniref:Serine hydrolase n=1 Tax=Croceibacterium salegens TaxID=1737568 RepID=A0A6I4SSJ7_9SPHN|nr:serine hydrolase [Croceibacterium salegens]MXO58961.1 serine hydrolase [Croceibacterium salegens]